MRTFATNVPPPGYRHIYLEPHLDDAALSCGGAIRAQADRDEPVLVVTVFAANPGAAAVTEFAAGQHARWSLDADPVAARRAEQVAALTVLGADWVPLDFLDAIYRGDQYRLDDDLFGPIKSDDRALVPALAALLAEIAAGQPGARWYVPLALGSHVDHQIALQGSAAILERRAYEDFPYGARHGVPTEPRPGTRKAELIDITATLDARIAAIACYRSQLGTLFGGPDAMEATVRQYVRERGGEQLWVL